MEEIKLIKQNYNDIKFIFDFYDRLALKLKKVSLKEKNENTLVFYDYYTEENYFVLIRDINKILDYCYNEYFFKIVLSGSSYYQQVKKICNDLEIENYVFDLFFRSFFFAIKDRFDCEKANNYDYNKDRVLWVVLNAYSDSFSNFPFIDKDFYYKKVKIILEKLEDLNMISYKEKDITKNIRLRSYFPISCNTFKFAIPSEVDNSDDFEKSIPMFDFLDLRQYLDNSEVLNHNLLSRMDRALQTLVVISFKDARFYNNLFSDNSYIKKLKLDKKILEQKKKNA